ncbi:Protein of unknown function (DUF962) [seawater metagenome]|uniref:DUF962 domain-containing protein n=1 Tax=seawater metagenome TaxID=1561972 RepID=A0A5E8CI04_9ZZZZ
MLNLEKQYLFYRNYHKNPVNQLLHIYSIPLLVITISIWGSYSGSILDTEWFFLPSEFNITAILCCLYSIYYIILNPWLGLLMTLILWTIQVFSFLAYKAFPNIWILAVIIHIKSWVIQLLGHSIFEKNKPAFLTGFVQSFLMAPLFVLMEVCFAFGFFNGLKSRIEQKAN